MSLTKVSEKSQAKMITEYTFNTHLPNLSVYVVNEDGHCNVTFYWSKELDLNGFVKCSFYIEDEDSIEEVLEIKIDQIAKVFSGLPCDSGWNTEEYWEWVKKGSN